MRMETVVDKMNQVLGPHGQLKALCDAAREKFGKKAKKKAGGRSKKPRSVGT